jgi:hypothetical protein
MNYEPAKELADAGFPEGAKGVWVYPMDALVTRPSDRVYAPTLDELIEALGDVSSFSLYNDGVNWEASYKNMNVRVSACTPTEAVVRLWLALNRKEE